MDREQRKLIAWIFVFTTTMLFAGLIIEYHLPSWTGGIYGIISYPIYRAILGDE